MDITMEGDTAVIRQFSTQFGAFPATDMIHKVGKTFRLSVTPEGKNWKQK